MVCGAKRIHVQRSSCAPSRCIASFCPFMPRSPRGTAYHAKMIIRRQAGSLSALTACALLRCLDQVTTVVLFRRTEIPDFNVLSQRGRKWLVSEDLQQC